MAADSDTTRIERGAGAGPPKRFGRFEVRRVLGRGAAGTVYLAEDEVIGRPVAIKEIPFESSEVSRAETRARFQVEFRAAGKLSHPNIATVYDVFEGEGAHCIAMEYVHGTSLADRLGSPPSFSRAEVLALAGQIAAGLDYAHRHGVVHRDVKPANVLVSEDGVAKITDFGIAKLLSVELTQTGMVLGTPSFMSPEQIQGLPLDGRSDQFSFGVILYQMLTGRLPFQADNPASLLYKTVHQEPERPSAVEPAIPELADLVLLRALSKEPRERYPNCLALVQDLQAALATAPAAPSSSPLPLPPPEAASEPERRRAWPAFLIGAALLGLLAGAVWLGFDPERRDEPAPNPSVQEARPAPAAPAEPVPVVPTPEETPLEEPEPSVAEPPRPNKGLIEVSISSESGNCQVSVDGRHRGFTPITLRLAPGQHEFACSWPSRGRRVFVETVSPSQRQFNLRP